MATATLNGVVIAQSDDTVMVEGNHYFPVDSVAMEYFAETEKATVCPWKGTASYYTVTIDGTEAKDTAWIYHEPKDAAAEIAGHIAFWGQVQVS